MHFFVKSNTGTTVGTAKQHSLLNIVVNSPLTDSANRSMAISGHYALVNITSLGISSHNDLNEKTAFLPFCTELTNPMLWIVAAQLTF